MTPAEVTAAKFTALQAMAKDNRLTSTEARLGIVLLGYFNADYSYAWPSNATLAQDLDAHRTSVTRAWQGLQAKGHFVVQENKGRGTTNHYYPAFVFPPATELSDASPHTIDASLHNKGCSPAQEGMHGCGKIPSRKPFKTPITKPLRGDNGKFSSHSQGSPPDGGPQSELSDSSIAEPLEPTEATASVTEAPNCLQGDRVVSEAKLREATAALMSKTMNGSRGPVKPQAYWTAKKDSDYAAGLNPIDQEEFWNRKFAEDALTGAAVHSEEKVNA
jgi:hypothetical protein